MLHLEVALANTPEELRDELRTRLQRSDTFSEEPQDISPRTLLRELRSLASEDGTVERMDVVAHLDKKGVEMPADCFMEQAEVECVVIRVADGRWMFFE